MSKIQWEFMHGQDMLAELPDKIRGVSRFALQVMTLSDDELTRPAFDAVAQEIFERPELAQRTIIFPDQYALLGASGNEPAKQVERVTSLINHFSELGALSLFGHTTGKIRETAQKYLSALIGVDHRKLLVTGDTSYIPTDNFLRRGAVVSYATKTDAPAVADRLYAEIETAAHGTTPNRDRALRLDEENALLVTHGGFGQSLILDTANEIAKDAIPGTLHLVTQFRPGGALDARLRHAAPKIVAFTSPKNMPDKLDREQEALRLLGPIPGMCVPEDTIIHGQTLTAIIRPNSNRQILPNHSGPITLTGSANLHWLEKVDGVAEASLLSVDPQLHDDANKLIEADFKQTA